MATLLRIYRLIYHYWSYCVLLYSFTALGWFKIYKVNLLFYQTVSYNWMLVVVHLWNYNYINRWRNNNNNKNARGWVEESHSQMKERRSVFWWFGCGYFCIFCQTAAGCISCAWGGCCLWFWSLEKCWIIRLIIAQACDRSPLVYRIHACKHIYNLPLLHSNQYINCQKITLLFMYI